MRIVRFAVSVVTACALAAPNSYAQAPFAEEALARGLAYFNQDYNWSFTGFGVLLCDLNHDGAPDAMGIGGWMDMPGLFENSGTGHFTDITASSGLEPIPYSSATLAFDYDADGDLDLYISSFDGRNALARNERGMITELISPKMEFLFARIPNAYECGTVVGYDAVRPMVQVTFQEKSIGGSTLVS